MADTEDQAGCKCPDYMKESVLCLDGGGVRTLSSLLILQHLLVLIRDARLIHDRQHNLTSSAEDSALPLACHYFSFMFGSGTGGIVAIMLGRLRMSIDDCIEVYKVILREVFLEKQRFHLVRQEKHDTEKLEQVLRRVIERYSGDRDSKFLDSQVIDSEAEDSSPERMRDRSTACRVGVYARQELERNQKIHLFRSYHNPTSADNLVDQFDARIWEIARATSAAPTYFRPMEIEGSTYLDGGLIANNPSKYSMAEVVSMHKHQLEGRCLAGTSQAGVRFFVSIGAGRESDSVKTNNANTILRSILQAVPGMTDQERDHEWMSTATPENVYYRFEVQQGLEDLELGKIRDNTDGQHSMFAEIENATTEYIETADTRKSLRLLAMQLVDHNRQVHQAQRHLFNKFESEDVSHPERAVLLEQGAEIGIGERTSARIVYNLEDQAVDVPDLLETTDSRSLFEGMSPSTASLEIDLSAFSSAWDREHPPSSTLPTEHETAVLDETQSPEKQNADILSSDDVDRRSIASVDHDIQSIAETATFLNVRESAAYEVAKAFTAVRTASELYDHGVKAMGDDFFLRNHQRLLKLFYLGALVDAETASEKLVVRFFRSQNARKRISDRIVSMSAIADEVANTDTVEDRDHRLRHLESLLTKASVSDTTAAWANDITDGDDDDNNGDHEQHEQSASDDEDSDFGTDEDGPSGLLPDAVPPLIAAANFLTSGQAFQVYQNNLARFVRGIPLAPESFRAALELRDVDEATRLLSEDTSAVAQRGFEFDWVAEPLEMGLSASDVVDAILEDKAQGFWIYYDLPVLEDHSVDIHFHRQDCMHPGLQDLERSLSSKLTHHAHDPTAPSRDSIRRIVAEFCGLAGVVMHRDQVTTWDGSVSLEGTTASITYQISSDKASSNHNIARRALNAMNRVMMLTSWLQKYRLVCDRFVILRQTLDTPEVQSVSIYFEHIAELRLDLQRLITDLEDAKKTNESQSQVLHVSLVLLETICGAESVDREEIGKTLHLSDSTDVSLDTTIDLCAVVVQALCIGMLAFSQANTGDLCPFFTTIGLSKIHLQGAQGHISKCLSLTLETQDLTCVGDMLDAPVMVFCCSGVLASTKVSKRHLQTSLEDLFEVWGPGRMIVDCDGSSEQSIHGAEIGGGLLYRSSIDSDLFHWTREVPTNKNVLNPGAAISLGERIVIGGLFTINNNCILSMEVEKKAVAERVMPTLETPSQVHKLGTYSTYWTLQEVQSGIQAGNYAMLTFNLTWIKSNARTLKQEMLDEDLDLNSLEEPWGVLISVCTGVAQRVPIREVIAEAVVPMVEAWAKKPVREWNHLVSHGDGIAQQFRKPTFRKWYDSLNELEQGAVIRIASHVLRRICWTGINREEQLVVAYPTSGDANACVRIPCKDNQVWASVLKDSETCATFACLTTRCIQTDQQKCCGFKNREWLNKTSLLITAVCQYEWLGRAEVKIRQRCLEQGAEYYMGYPGDQYRFVARVSANSPTTLTLSESRMPKRIRSRLREGMARVGTSYTKLRERRLVSEAHAEEVLLHSG